MDRAYQLAGVTKRIKHTGIPLIERFNAAYIDDESQQRAYESDDPRVPVSNDSVTRFESATGSESVNFDDLVMEVRFLKRIITNTCHEALQQIQKIEELINKRK